MARVRWLGAALVAALATVAPAQELAFVEPAQPTVRGTVPVQIDLGVGRQQGYVVFYLGEPGKPLAFKVATVADREGLFGFQWETQARGARVADGEYRLLAIGYNAAGEVLGQKATTVQVQNEVTSASLPARGVLLRYNLTPGRENRYVARSRVQVTPGQGAAGSDVSMFNNSISAWWNSRVLWRQPDGRAQVRNSIFQLFERGARGESDPLPGNGEFVSMMLEGTGRIIRRTEQAAVRFPLAEVGLVFSPEPVKVGDSWRSPIQYLVDPRTLRDDTVIGTHTLSGVEWHAGYRAAVIDSEYEGGPYTIELKGEDKDNEEWLATVTLTIKGKRRTYFAYQPEVGRVLRIDEQQDQSCTLELEEEPVAQMGGEGAMPGAEVGAGPGAPGVGAGLGPGGVPGAVGPDAMAAQQLVGGKPAGFEKGGRAFRKASGASATAVVGMEATGMPEQAPPPPPKVDIIHFKRDVQSTILQDFLDNLG